ncbi:MAG: hypothetical protein ABEI31_06150 [Halodesulfurarchaeum sp.]
MLQRLGLLGWTGIVLLLVGVATVAIADPVIAVGLVLVLVGTRLIVKRAADEVMGLFGM